MTVANDYNVVVTRNQGSRMIGATVVTVTHIPTGITMTSAGYSARTVRDRLIANIEEVLKDPARVRGYTEISI